ncbi:hypothetical protein [Chryseobacterium sp. ISL-6]|uniref:hypothetical protein n=1 Tax=Chryseobacterium sp. ISL-6 TaxID=2819143 RepID=UPI001BE9E498|nr:hypothetical protein [Chryseobacterium sp. ISL-6]MBT2620283.1 hypothetical protein [Chryseobacterium sp. ISL-6]
MNFKKEFPNLDQFFAGYFPDADFDNLTDEEVVENYIADCNSSEVSKKTLDKVREELPLLIDNIESYWQIVGDEANRYFENSHDALEWLMMIKKELNN